MLRLSVRLVTLSLGLFSAVMFVACGVYGLLFPSFHASWLLEAVLPGFHWLSIGALLLGVVETFLYGGLAGLVFSTIYNWLAPRVEPDRAATMRRATVVVVAAMLSLAPLASFGASPLAVTVQELIQQDHRMTVRAGTEVQWRDSHFERVWFPAAADAPKVTRIDGGFRAVFEKAGTYRGRFTIIGGHRSNDVYPLMVVVTEP